MKTNNMLPPEQRGEHRGGKFIPALCNFCGMLILLAVICASIPLTVPRYMGYEIYGVVSGSMAPEIPIGSVIYTKPLAPEDVAVGDVIAFESGSSVITHRVVENRYVEGQFVTKGDANAREDLSAVPYDALLGRVERHFPVVGRLMMLYSSTVGKVYVLLFAACGVMLNILAGRMRASSREHARLRLMRQVAEGKGVSVADVPDGGARPGRRRGRVLRRVVMALLLIVFLGSGGVVMYVQRQYELNDQFYAGASLAYTRPAEEFLAELAEGGADAAPADEKTEAPEYAPLYVDFDALLAANGDVAGWLYCADTVIDYPVLHGEDDDYYLHRTYDGAYSVSGSIFTEAENSADFSDANTIVYGHHMKNGSMFACLQNWADQSWYEEHPVMYLLTPERDYKLVLFSGYTTAAGSDTYTVFTEPGGEFAAYLADAAARSDFETDVTPDGEGRCVVLSTCAYVFDNARYVLHAALVPLDSAGGVPLR